MEMAQCFGAQLAIVMVLRPPEFAEEVETPYGTGGNSIESREFPRTLDRVTAYSVSRRWVIRAGRHRSTNSLRNSVRLR